MLAHGDVAIVAAGEGTRKAQKALAQAGTLN
jgi:hypothetical protein